MIAAPTRALGRVTFFVALSACGGTTPPETLTVDATPTASAANSARPAADKPFKIATFWERPLDPSQWPLVQGMVRGPGGEIALAVTSASEVTIFVLGANGKTRWEARIREAGDGFAHYGGMGFDADANLVVGGQFAHRLEVSGNWVFDTSFDAAFVVAFDRQGALRWSRAVQGNGVAIPTLRVGPRRDAISLAGAFGRDITLGDEHLEGGGAGDGVAGSLFLSRLDLSGNVQWAKVFPGNAVMNEVVDDGAGNVLLAGDFFGAFAPEGFPELVGDGDQGRGGYVMLTDKAGAPRWIKQVGAQGIAAASDGSYFFCGGPWERFGRRRLGSLRPGGAAGVDRDVGLLTCNGVAMGNDGHLIVYGSVQRGEADPKTGGVNTSARVLDVTREGVVLSGVTLPLDATGSNPFVVPHGKDGALVASSFRVDHEGAIALIVYRLSR